CVCVCVYTECVCVCVCFFSMCACVCVHVCVTVAQVLALPPHCKKVSGSIPAWGAVGSGGQVLPRPSVLGGGLSPGPFCVEFACSQGASSTKKPNRKNMQNMRTHVPPCQTMVIYLHTILRT